MEEPKLQQGWVGRMDGVAGTERDGWVHAHLPDDDVALCGVALRLTEQGAWPPQALAPCPACEHGALALPRQRRPNNPYV